MNKLFIALASFFIYGAVYAQQDSLIYHQITTKNGKSEVVSCSKYTFVDKDTYSYTYYVLRPNQKIKKSLSELDKNKLISQNKWLILREYKVSAKKGNKLQLKTGNGTSSFKSTIIVEKRDSIYYYKHYSKENKLMREGLSHIRFPLTYEGEQIMYDKEGGITGRAVFKDKKLIESSFYKNGEKTELGEGFYGVAPATMKGGEKALQQFIFKNLNYPIMAREMGIAGKLILSFRVNENGEVSDIRVEDSVHESIDAEGVRLVKQTAGMWIPSIYNGEFISCRMKMPLRFVLQ